MKRTSLSKTEIHSEVFIEKERKNRVENDKLPSYRKYNRVRKKRKINEIKSEKSKFT